MTLGQGQVINVGPQDLSLSVSQVLPAAGAAATTGILDLQALAPNSNAWRLGRFLVSIPAIPENNDTTKSYTIDLKVAPPSLTAGAAQVAPQNVVPGTFVTPTCAQKITITGVGVTGSLATNVYFTLAFDGSGSVYQFYEFVVTAPAGITASGEVINIGWING